MIFLCWFQNVNVHYISGHSYIVLVGKTVQEDKNHRIARVSYTYYYEYQTRFFCTIA